MKKIYFPIFSDSLEGNSFSLQKSNPGVGGTQFTTISLALSLGLACPTWNIVFASSTKIDIENPSKNISQEQFSNASGFFKDLNFDETSIVISTVATLTKIDTVMLRRIETKLICWCHHPFDQKVKTLAARINLKAVVCVGIYQYYSNNTINSKVHYIQNIFNLPNVAPKREHKYFDKLNFKNEQINIVSLGALVPGKGFSEIAKSWNELKSRISDIRLHVIGSSATYGDTSETKLVPTTKDYAHEILKYISKKDIRDGNIIFHGNLGESKFTIISQCDIAILNPTGRTEAFPASPLECMACGLPVIASDDYGMSDCMRSFPELAVSGHKDIARKVEWLLSNPLRYQEIQQRSLSTAKWFDSQDGQIIMRWVRLIEAVRSGASEELNLSPILPFYGSTRKLVFRRDIRPHVWTVKRYGKKTSGYFNPNNIFRRWLKSSYD